MKFIPYIDANNQEQFFDPSTAKFTLSQPLGILDDINNPSEGWGCKVCLGDHIFIIAKEEPASIIARIKEANGV
tara:strand:+ start:184 stop:405 length:222 start_codon:yes stop_codon:yes gene_type:complete